MDTSGSRDVGQRLRELRRRAWIGGVEAARRAGLSQSKISKLENGRLRASPDDVRTLCEVYGTPPAECDNLVHLATEVLAESQLSKVVLSRGAARLQQRIGQMEAQAALLRTYQPTMVPGLLQTPAYARLVFGHGLARDDTDAAVKARRERANRLADDSRQFVLVLTEGALRWQAGSARLMVDQIDAIVDATRLPNVQVGIIPWMTPVDVFCTHAFHLYDSTAVVIGTEVASGILTAVDDVQVYEQLFSRLEPFASFGDQARRELARIRSDFQLLGD